MFRRPNPSHRTGFVKALIAAFVFASTHDAAFAVDKFWNDGTASYNIGANWTPSGVPGSGDNVFNNNGLGNVVQINAIDPAWTVNDVQAGTVLGTAGAFTQNGSTVTLNAWMRLGTAAGAGGSTGSYTLNGGTLNVNAGNLFVGEAGNNNAAQAGVGTLTVTNGTLNKKGGGVLAIGNAGTGTLTLSGGLIDATDLIILGDRDTGFGGNPDSATGTVNHSGGTLTSGGELWVGQGTGGTGAAGTYNLSGPATAIINANNWLAIGRANATGVFNMSGGVINKNATGNLTVGSLGGTGTLDQSGGTITNTASQTFIGEAGTGTYTVSGAAVANLGILQLAVNAGAVGTVHLNGGTLNPTQITKGAGTTATFNFNGGTLQTASSSGTFMTGLTTANVRNGGAIINTNGNSPTIGQALVHSTIGGDAATDGGLTKSGAGTLTLSGANSFTGNIAINGGTLSAAGAANGAAPTTSSLGAPNTARTINVNNTGTLSFGASDQFGNHNAPMNVALVIASGGTVTNSGAFFNSLGAVTLNGGTLTATGGGSADFPSYGLKGTVTAGISATSTISASGTNAGLALGEAAVTGTTFDVGAGSTLNVTASLFDGRNTLNTGFQASTLTKTGTGTLTLNAANTYTGTTTVSAGTLALAGAGNPSNRLRGTINVNSGGTLRLDNANLIANNGAITVDGTGTFNMQGNLDYFQSLTLTNGGSVQGTGANGGFILEQATPTLSASGTGNSVSSKVFIASNFAAVGGNKTLEVNVASGGGLTITGEIANGTPDGGAGVLVGSLNKTGTGTLTLNAANTYTGTTTVSAGTLALDGAGNPSNRLRGTINVNSGGTLRLDNANLIANNGAITVDGTGTFNMQGNLDYFQSVTLTNGGSVQGTGANGGFILEVASPQIAASGTGNSISSKVFLTSNFGLVGGNKTLAIDVAGAGNLSISGEIANGTPDGGGAGLVGSVTKTGLGTLTLTGTNTYTGATNVNAGTLVVGVGGVGSIANSAVNVNAGGTLKGSGTIGSVNITGGTFSPGNSPGTMNTGAAIYGPAGTYIFELDQVVTGGGLQNALRGIDAGHDWQNITGSLSITATSGTPFVINITGLSHAAGHSPDVQGLVTNWDPHNSYTWTIATASGGLGGTYAANKFSFLTTNFANNNPLAGGTFSTANPIGSPNDLQLIFTPAAAGTINAYWDTNGSTAGAGATPTGVWSTSTANWNLDASGGPPYGTYNWTNGDNAVFSAGTDAANPFTVTISGTVNAHNITFEAEGTATITGGTLNLQGATPTITTTAAQATINSTIGDVSAAGLTKAGAGILTLGGANNYTGATNVNAGTLRLGASEVLPNGTTLTLSTGGTLDINGQTETITRLNINSSTVTQSNGTLNLTQAGDFPLRLGDAAGTTAVYNLSGTGIINITGNPNFGGSGTGTFNQTGGTVSSAGFTVIARNTGSTGLYNISAGTLDHTNAGTRIIVGENGAGTLTISGTGLVQTIGGVNIGGTLGGNGTVNLNGGTLITPLIDAQAVAGTQAFFFNGGTLRANANNATFVQNIDTLQIRNGGAIIDSNGFNIGIAQGLAHSTQGGDAAQDGGLTKIGAGTLTLTGASNYTGPTLARAGTTVVDTGGNISSTFYVSVGQQSGDVGRLTVQGTGQITTNLDFNVSDLSGSTGLLTVAGSGAVNASTLYVGKNANTAGYVNQTGGTVTKVGGGGDWRIADNGSSVGVYNISGGTLTPVNNFQIGASGTGQMNLSGTGTVNAASFPVVGRFGGSFGMLDVAGGNFNQTGAGNFLIIGEQGTGIMNVRGGTVTVSSTDADNALSIGHTNTAGTTGIVNLLSGTLATRSVGVGDAAASSTFNFNGGTLQATGATGTFMGGLDNAYVFSGGAIVDSNGFNIGMSQPLVAPMGGGVTNLAVSGGGTGYLAAPIVKISGDGTGATAVATMSGGVVTGIIITNPGVGYSGATYTLTGGSPTLAATTGAATIAANSTAGGLTKLSAGELTLSGASTYGGNTDIRNGAIVLSGGINRLPVTTSLNLGNGVNSGILKLNGNDQTIAGISTAGTGLNNRVVNGSGTFATLFINNAAANTLGGILGGGLANENNFAVTKTNTGTLSLTNTNTFTGNLTVNGGLAGIVDIPSTGAITQANEIWVAQGASGRLDVNGGSIASPNFIVAGRENGTGIINLNTGTATTNTVTIGALRPTGINSTVGTFNVGGGGSPATLTTNNLWIAEAFGGGANPTTGTLNLMNNGLVNANTSTIVGFHNAANGTLNVSGGTLNTPHLIVANDTGATGLVSQTGGTINVTALTTYRVGNNGSGVVDSAGTGTVNHSAGLTNVTGGMVLGDNPTTGPVVNSYNLSGTGNLNFADSTGVSAHHQVTPGSPSSITINADAAFNFTGGMLRDVSTITALSNGNTFTQGGGTFVIGQDEISSSAYARTTTINGGFSLLNGGIVKFDAFGPEATTTLYNDVEPIDLLRVTGTANLNGIFDFDDEYGAEFGDVHTLMLAPVINLGPNFAIQDAFFRVVPTGPTGPGFALQAIVPEPASVAVWSIIGLAGATAAWRMRRRRK